MEFLSPYKVYRNLQILVRRHFHHAMTNTQYIFLLSRSEQVRLYCLSLATNNKPYRNKCCGNIFHIDEGEMAYFFSSSKSGTTHKIAIFRLEYDFVRLIISGIVNELA